MPHQVAVLIPNWNGVDVLERCLPSILGQAKDVDLEVVVIDNGSDDGSREIVAAAVAANDRVRAIYNPENCYFAAACNQGYRASEPPFVLLANNDVEAEPGAIATLVAHLLDNPKAAVAAARLILPDGRPQEAYRRLPNAAFVIAHYHRVGRALDRLLLGRRLQDRYFYRDQILDRPQQVDQPGATFCLLRRAAVDAVGGLFDERFPLLMNDVDLSFRLHAAGWQSHLVPDATVVHYHGVASRSIDPEIYLRLQFSGLFEYFLKYHPGQLLWLGLAWPGRFLRWLAQGRSGSTG